MDLLKKKSVFIKYCLQTLNMQNKLCDVRNTVSLRITEDNTKFIIYSTL